MSTPTLDPKASFAARHPVLAGGLLGLLGVTVFALTLPMTRLATGSAEAPQMSPWFVTWARCSIAGLLSLLFLWLTRSPRPNRVQMRWISLALLGNALGFPLLLAWALRHVTASHAAVFTALLPLTTAAAAAWLLHQRARLGFWVFAVLGSVLVAAYSLLRAQGMGGDAVPVGLVWADGLLLGAIAAAALGYVGGAQVTPALGAERVISWVCVLTLPLALPMTWWTWPEHPIRLEAWLALAYVGVFSMWAGFFAWFRGLALGGALRVSQLQLFQPFISIAAAAAILGETVDALTLAFALAVVATVYAGKRWSSNLK